jgi:PAS domain-containing protein
LCESLESSTDGILVVHQSGRMTPLNTRAARVLGFPQRLVRRLAVEAGLRRALEREEFDLHY